MFIINYLLCKFVIYCNIVYLIESLLKKKSMCSDKWNCPSPILPQLKKKGFTQRAPLPPSPNPPTISYVN